MEHSSHIAAFYRTQVLNSVGKHWYIKECLQLAYTQAWRACGEEF